MRTGPLTRKSFDFARSISSWQTFSSDCTFREVKVMRILWIFCGFKGRSQFMIRGETGRDAMADLGRRWEIDG